jgi:ABC-type branched-subunit amino acid transport system ATPase component
MNLSWLKRSSSDAVVDDVTGTPDGPLLSCRGVDVAYDKVQVLFGVDLDVERGEIVALLGTNGAGKSTLLKAVSGLVQPVAGQVCFDGKDITRPTPSPRRPRASCRCPAARRSSRR